jgi:hypothetical protein
MGNPAAEELFTMVADAGVDRFKVVIAPVDFRLQTNWKQPKPTPTWVLQLHDLLREELAALPRTRQGMNR